MSAGSDALRARASAAEIAGRCGVAESTARRWRTGAMSPDDTKRQALFTIYDIPPADWDAPAAEGAEPPPMGSLRDEAEAHLERARRRRNAASTAAEVDKADKEVRAALELLMRVDGTITTAADEARLAASPKFRAIREAMFSALEKFPEALAAVCDALERLEAGNGSASS